MKISKKMLLQIYKLIFVRSLNIKLIFDIYFAYFKAVFEQE